MKFIYFSVLICFCTSYIYAQQVDSTKIVIDQIEQSLNYDTGYVDLENAYIVVPQGFKFLDKAQSIYVLSDLWGNPPDTTIMGCLLPADLGVLSQNTWLFTIHFNEMGYVKDDDAADIDYDKLLADLQTESKEENKARIEAGYAPIQMVGWASKPFYDDKNKTLHWAKELKFGEDEYNTLNYNLRVLGRRGVYEINAIASMNQFNAVKPNIDKVLKAITYKDGEAYADFDGKYDNVAAWTIGSLVAGKVLAKAGFFAVIAKFWKVIALALAGVGGAFWRRITGKKKDEEIDAEATNHDSIA